MKDTSNSKIHLPPVALLLLFLLAFAPTLVWMGQGWFAPGSYFGHGPLLVICGIVFLRRVAKDPRAVRVQASKPAAVLFTVLLVLHVFAQTIQVDSLSGMLMVPTALALVWALYGAVILRLVAPAIGCFFFAVPLPIFVTGRLAYGMKDIAASCAVFIGNLAGLGLEQDGAKLIIPGQDLPLLVGDACAGLRSLVALTALGYVFAFFLTDRRPVGRILLLLSALPVALMANFLRIAVLAGIATVKGVPYAAGPAHEISGYLVYLAAIFLLFVIDRFLPFRRAKAIGDGEALLPVASVAVVPAKATRLAVLLLLLGLPAVFLGFYRPSDPRMGLASQVPEETAQFKSLGDEEISERWYGLLGTRDVCWRRYEHKQEKYRINLTAVFHGNNWKSIHPPDSCLAASGFSIETQETRSFRLGDQELTLAVLQAKKRRHAYLVAYAYLGFFLENLPAAVLRRPTRGCLFRVDVPLDANSSVPDAEKRLSTFLGEILPPIRALLK